MYLFAFFARDCLTVMHKKNVKITVLASSIELNSGIERYQTFCGIVPGLLKI